MVERLVRQIVTSISAAAAVSALRRTSSSIGPSWDIGVPLYLLAVDDESRALRDLVVEPHRRRVRLVRLPVDARRTGLARLRVDRLDQRAPDTLAARRLAGEEILQIAGRSDHRRAAMKDVMDEAEKLLVELGDQGVNGLVGIEEARPRHLGDRRGNRALVKAVIALPERLPPGEIGGGDGTDDQGT